MTESRRKVMSISLRKVFMPFLRLVGGLAVPLNAGFTVENHQTIGDEVLGYNVVFNHKGWDAMSFNNPPKSLSHVQAFFNVQVCAWLIKKEQVSFAAEAGSDGDFLKLSTA